MWSRFGKFLLVWLGLHQVISQRGIWIGEEPEVPQLCPSDSPYRVEVRQGDCLSMLAEASSTSVDRWMISNPRIADNNWLDIGWSLCAPAGAAPIRNLKKCGDVPPETIIQPETFTQPFQPVPFRFQNINSSNHEIHSNKRDGGLVQCIFLVNHIADCQDNCLQENTVIYLTPLLKLEKRTCYGKTNVSHDWNVTDGIIARSALNSTSENNSPVVASCLFHVNTPEYECSGISVCRAVRTAQYYDCTYATWWRGVLVSGNPLHTQDRLVGKSVNENPNGELQRRNTRKFTHPAR